MGKTPSFSVVVPCYNQARFLHTAVDSALDQSHPDVQVIVVNDGSSDETLTVAQSYGERVRLVDQENRGLAAARNAGLRIATGEFVNFLDADDWLDPDFLRHQAEAIQSSSSSVFVGEWTLCNVEAKPLTHGEFVVPGDAYRFLLGGNRMPCQSLTARRTAVEGIGLFDESLKAYEDWDLWLRLAAAGHHFAAAPKARVFYRRHEGTMSRDIERMLGAARKVLEKHRGNHWSARLRATKAIRYGMFCTNVLARSRQIRRQRGAWQGWRSLFIDVLRHPSFIESATLYVLFAACPPIRRLMGVAEFPAIS